MMNSSTEERAPAEKSRPDAPTRLWSRTFVGLLISQFWAAFNDQAIHASAMFFAINTQTLNERDAISLMPILFFAPWAIFCTLAGYFADRYSKRNALVFWKVAEVGITAVAALGFWLGRSDGSYNSYGPWIVLSTVFLMGMHSAFFVPAKYGAMPEILPPHLLSRGNGILESLSFLAVIFGTVSGGILSYLFQGQEFVIGLILFALALAGALASLLIRKIPPANDQRPFPSYIYGPLVASVRRMIAPGPLRLAVTGIAFFTFVVAFMRAVVYMLGESRNPRWDELKTSAVVGTTALGIGIGSPLAGWLSGKRVELRLVPLGACGMILGCLMGAVVLGEIPKLVGCIIAIGFCTGFYIVPLYTLLQHSAPKSSKGEMIAMSNFINISGAISASLLFFGIVFAARTVGWTPQLIAEKEFHGKLTKLELSEGRPVYVEVVDERGVALIAGAHADAASHATLGSVWEHVFADSTVRAERIEIDKRLPPPTGTLYPEVKGAVYSLDGVHYFDLIPANQKFVPRYDQRGLPQYLFVGAAGLTALMLLAIARPLRRALREGV